MRILHQHLQSSKLKPFQLVLLPLNKDLSI